MLESIIQRMADYDCNRMEAVAFLARCLDVSGWTVYSWMRADRSVPRYQQRNLERILNQLRIAETGNRE